MIKYTPFWKTIEEKNISQYALINKYKFSSSTINNLKHNKHINTNTLNNLCNVLKCKVEDIIVHEPDL